MSDETTRKGPPDALVRAAGRAEQDWLLTETIEALKGRCVALRVRVEQLEHENAALRGVREGAENAEHPPVDPLS